MREMRVDAAYFKVQTGTFLEELRKITDLGNDMRPLPVQHLHGNVRMQIFTILKSMRQK
jgi:hypothetical protein